MDNRRASAEDAMEDSHHCPVPTPQEAEWMESSAVDMMFRAVGLAGLALAIGVAVSMLLETTAIMPALLAAAGK